jgi:hypothetical protein
MSVRAVCVTTIALLVMLASLARAQGPAASQSVSTDRFSKEVTEFLGNELAAHVADVKSLDPPQERVLGASTLGEFSWGAFMRALASYSVLSRERTIAGTDVPQLIGKIGLIEASHGGKSFAQLYAGLALLHFGADLNKNPVWQSLSPEERTAWRSLLDPARFYDRKTRHVINLPENYFGVAARVASMDYQLGLITDRAFVDDVINRAAEQFTKGALYSDDALPAGRYDRYSNEYARYVYLAAEGAGRKDVMQAMEPTLKAQMRLWWDLLSPDGYGYPWGRSLGAISYIDTLEIVGFLAEHPQFRPAQLPQLASAYYAAWQWLMSDYQHDRHLLNVLGFGRGNYSYINKEREWQQSGAFFGKAAGAHIWFTDATRREGVKTFPGTLVLPNVARFEFFRKGDRPEGVWLVRRGNLRFALPIVTGTKPGVSDYLPAPYNLTGFAPPVEQMFPTVTPYLELEDRRVIVAGDGADQIIPSVDGLSVRAVWKHWAQFGTNAGKTVDPSITSDVTWRIEGDSLVRTEVWSASQTVKLRRISLAVPTTGDEETTRYEKGVRTDRFRAPDGTLEVAVQQSDLPFTYAVHANGNTPLGRGSRGAVPMYLELEANNVVLQPGTPAKWTLVLTPHGAMPSGDGASARKGE